jgi:hypothetical protein
MNLSPNKTFGCKVMVKLKPRGNFLVLRIILDYDGNSWGRGKAKKIFDHSAWLEVVWSKWSNQI